MSSENTPSEKGYKPVGEDITLASIEKEREKRKEEEAECNETALTDTDDAEEKTLSLTDDVTRRRFFILAGLAGAGAVMAYSLGQSGKSEFAEQADKMIETIELDDFLKIDEQQSHKALKMLAEKLENQGYILDEAEGSLAANNHLSPKWVEAVGDDLMDEDLEELPTEFGIYNYMNHGMEILQPHMLRETAAEAFTEAHEKMLEETGTGIQLVTAYRLNIHQNDLFANYGTDQTKPASRREGLSKAANPGTSLHEFGLAVDVSNWMDAKSYLEDAGFHWLGHARRDERHHFQWGISVEKSMLMEGEVILKKAGKVIQEKGGKWLNRGRGLLDKFR